jgi:propanol-preferring alcohol dehydrogenase
MHRIMAQIAQPSEVCVPFAELVVYDVRAHGNLVSKYSTPRSLGESNANRNKFARRVSEDAWSVANTISSLTNPSKGLKEPSKAVELAHSGQMQDKSVILIDEEAF